MSKTLAVYTTIYPGVEPYLAEWSRSLREQTDGDFELWIGLDNLDIHLAESLIGTDLKVNWVKAAFGATPAQIRQEALAKIVGKGSGVVLVDSDDVLHPSRVAAARAALENHELAGCALRLVDQHGRSLEADFNLPAGLDLADVFPRNNVFGFSNSVFRCDVLRECLPIPPGAVLVDWFLGTIAWLLGAQMVFDRVPRMDYRQHPGNTARVRFPIRSDQVVSDTRLVRQHFDLVLAEVPEVFMTERFDELRGVARDVELFESHVVRDSARLETYVDALNALAPPPLWWTCVAHPALKHLWSS